MKKISFITILALLLSVLSCELNVEDITRHVELEYITVDTSHAVTEYAVGAENFDTTCLKVIGHYSDDSEKEEDISLAKITGFNSSEEGPVTITVEYSGKKATYIVTVGKDAPEELIIENYPKQLLYWSDDKNFIYDGLELKFRMRSGKIENLSLDEVKLQTVPGNSCVDVQVIPYEYPDLWNSFTLYQFKDRDFFDSKGQCDKTIVNNIDFDIEGKIKITGYKENEEISFSGSDIIINNKYTGKFLLSIPANKVHVPNKIVSGTILDTKKVQLIINDESIYIPLNVIGKYITSCEVIVNQNNFIKNNYKGMSINFTDSSLFTFHRIFDDGRKVQIKFDSMEKTESLSFYNSEKKAYLNVKNNSYKLDKLGENTVKFKYSFYSDKLGTMDSYEFVLTFYIQDAKPESITADFVYKDSEKKYLPYEIQNNQIKDYITLKNLQVLKTDGSKFEFPLDENKIAFTCEKPSESSFSKDIKELTGTIRISYPVGTGTIEGTLSNVVFHKE